MAHLHSAGAFAPDQECTCWMSIRFSRFVRFLPSLTNWEIFFDLYEVFLRFFKKIFSTTFQEQKKHLSHHKGVIGAEIEKAR